MKTLINMFRGFCMALADSVPGVSGGTIAFLLGFYDKFISSLDDLIRGSKEARREAIKFLVKILLGWLIGYAIAVIALDKLFETHINSVCSLFIGFVIFSIPMIIKEEKKSLRDKIPYIWLIAVGALAVAGISLLGIGNGLFTIDVAKPSFAAVAYIFFACALGISAMVLPGISGSTILLIFGLYVPIITTVRKMLSLDFSGSYLIIVALCGAAFGIVAIIRIVRNCFEKFRGQMIYLILGMMIGSVVPIVNGPATLDTPLPPLNFSTFEIGWCALGAIIVLALQLGQVAMEKKLAGKTDEANIENGIAEKANDTDPESNGNEKNEQAVQPMKARSTDQC